MEDEAVVQETAAEHEKYLLIEQLVRLGTLRHGTSHSMVKAMLGPPGRGISTPKRYHYGRVDIVFGDRAKDGVQMIYMDMSGNCAVPILPPAPSKTDAPNSRQNQIGDGLCPPGSREAMEREQSEKVDQYDQGVTCPVCGRHIKGYRPVFPLFEVSPGPGISLRQLLIRRFGRDAARRSPLLRKSMRLKHLRTQIQRLARRYEKVLSGPPHVNNIAWER